MTILRCSWYTMGAEAEVVQLDMREKWSAVRIPTFTHQPKINLSVNTYALGPRISDLNVAYIQ